MTSEKENFNPLIKKKIDGFEKELSKVYQDIKEVNHQQYLYEKKNLDPEIVLENFVEQKGQDLVEFAVEIKEVLTDGSKHFKH